MHTKQWSIWSSMSTWKWLWLEGQESSSVLAIITSQEEYVWDQLSCSSKTRQNPECDRACCGPGSLSWSIWIPRDVSWVVGPSVVMTYDLGGLCVCKDGCVWGDLLLSESQGSVVSHQGASIWSWVRFSWMSAKFQSLLSDTERQWRGKNPLLSFVKHHYLHLSVQVNLIFTQ